MEDYRKIAQECVEAVGGVKNIKTVSMCTTRLRIEVYDSSTVDKERVKSIDKVKGLAVVGNQFQIILGNGTIRAVYKETADIVNASDNKNVVVEEKETFVQKVVGIFSTVFPAVLPAIICSGMLSGIRSILEYSGLISVDSNWYTLLSILCSTALDMLPVLVTWSTCKRFGGTEVLGIILGLMLVSGSLPSAFDVSTGGEPMIISLFGINFKIAAFQCSVLVAIFAGWMLASMEKLCREKIVPGIVDSIFTPLISVGTTFFVTMFFCGPVIRVVEQFLISAASWLITLPLGIGAFIFTFVYQFIVITGCHLAFDFLDMQFLANFGLDPIIPLVNCSIFGQCGACAAFIIFSKNKKDRASAVANTFSAAMGVTEPAIFNQTLPSKGMCGMICGSVGAAIGGMICSILGVKGTGFALGIWSIAIHMETGLWAFIIGILVSTVIGFVLTYIVLLRQNKKSVA
ncbi:MAG: PTS transporter subunit EIIC [Erysipelotrichia bacterium]|nr:PTS transporter subunit EIIC [Erysipelotrichia bacterium]